MAEASSIVLIGMMGAGKSSVGGYLERRTGLQRFDTDEMVAERLGMPIDEIFSRFGEERFRRAETEALSELHPNQPAIIVTGGGVVLREENVQHLKRLGVIIWLHAKDEVLYERASRRRNRPLLATEDPRATLVQLSAERAALYAGASDLSIDTSERGHEEVSELILSRVQALAAEREQI